MSKNTGKKKKGSVLSPKNAHRHGRVRRYRGMRNATTKLAPTLPPADAYAPWLLDGSAGKYSEYRKLEDQEVIPAEKRKYYGRGK